MIAVAAEMGGPASAYLDRVAAALRLRGADDRERKAQAAQAKLSALVLTVVPASALVLLLVTDPDVRRVLGTATGGLCVLIGLTLNAAGAWWMRRTIGAGR